MGMSTSLRLNVQEVTHIAREAAGSLSRNLRVAGVTVADRDGDYVEVIIDVEECHRAPCRVSVGVFRNASPDVVREHIVAHLQQHLDENVL